MYCQHPWDADSRTKAAATLNPDFEYSLNGGFGALSSI